ncbi:MAG TPA: TetR/AcrR family transcriptional regulator, partial [Bacillota bacterium]|nr:TetR/AcrR family transcriptional regulator [Bacillota bacterium]
PGIDDIAHALHIAKGTMYQYFKDKQELYQVIVEEAVEYLSQQYDWVGEEAGSLQEFLTGIIYETNLFNVKEYDFFKIHVSAGSSEMSSGNETYTPMRVLSVKMQQLLEPYYSDLRTDPGKVGIALTMTVNACCLYLMEMTGIPRNEITEDQIRSAAKDFAEGLISGYGKKESPQSP